ncbi:MAG: hypothetical protein VXZ76_02790 [Bacteroidota bacterium]|nr:hypothetical protein [Bacteroidota bacterium]
MRKEILSFLALFTIVATTAQTHEDALLFSENAVVGTARTAAMSNAFGALGADLSTLSNNPAGLGVYQSYEFAFSLNLGGVDMASYYLDNKITNSSGNFNIPSVGLVTPLKSSTSSDWRRTNLGFAYNTTKIFKANTIQSAYNPNSSLVDVFYAFADGYRLDDLDPFFELAAFDTDLIDLQVDSNGWIDDGNYFREVQTGQDQFKQTHTFGSMGEFAISFAGSYMEKLYLGATLGLTSIEYTKKSRYNERNFADTSSTVEYFDMYENQYTTGGGVNLKLGAIYRASENLRLGVAWHSPSLNELHDEWEMVLRTQHNNDSTYSYTYTSPYGVYDYTITTPMKVIGSAALVLDNILLSGDIEYVDYATMNIDGDDFDYFNNQQNIIESNYTSLVNARFGAELNLSPFVVRAGYAQVKSPYSDASTFNTYRDERKSYSFGIGKRNQFSYFDLAYIFTEYSNSTSLYNTYFEPAHRVTTTAYNLVFTMGWKF